MNNLSLLPYELYPIIFDSVNVKDLIKLRSVCKRLKYAIDKCYDRSIKELIISKFKNGSNASWYNLNRKINKNNFILIDIKLDQNFKQFKKIINLNLFKDIKLFKINFSPRSINRNLFDYLEKFSKLDQLEFTTYETINMTINIRNSNIKILYLYSFTPVFINCPNLEILHHRVKNSDLNSINYFKIKKLDNIFTKDINSRNILKFKNLEYIGFKKINYSNLNYLFNLNKLKIINLNNLWQLDRLTINIIKRLIEEKNQLNRDDLVIHFDYLKIKDDQLEKYNKKRKTNTYYYNNYSSM